MDAEPLRQRKSLDLLSQLAGFLLKSCIFIKHQVHKCGIRTHDVVMVILAWCVSVFWKALLGWRSQSSLPDPSLWGGREKLFHSNNARTAPILSNCRPFSDVGSRISSSLKCRAWDVITKWSLWMATTHLRLSSSFTGKVKKTKHLLEFWHKITQQCSAVVPDVRWNFYFFVDSLLLTSFGQSISTMDAIAAEVNVVTESFRRKYVSSRGI